MHVVSRAPFDTATRQFPNQAVALDDLYRVLKKENYPSPDQMRKRFPSLDRMKYREKWWVIDVGGGHLRVMFFADFERGRIFIKHISTHAEYDKLTENQRMNYTDAIKAASDLTTVLPFLGASPSRKDYEEALALVEYLIEHQPDSPLIDMLTAKIDKYEDESPEFAAFNARVATIPSGVALLRTLMDQYHLTQSDLENEIGKKSLVSRILNGQRTLTLDHMRALAKRFGLPVSAFVGN